MEYITTQLSLLFTVENNRYECILGSITLLWSVHVILIILNQ